MKQCSVFGSMSKTKKWFVGVVLSMGIFLYILQYTPSGVTSSDVSSRDKKVFPERHPSPVEGNISICEMHWKLNTLNSGSIENKSRTDSGKYQPSSNPHRSNEVRNVAFVKVHKAASTTVMNIVHRFGLSRKLNIMVPKREHLINEGYHTIKKANILPVPTGEKYNVICNHLVFNEKEIKRFVPKSTKFVGIVREPFAQFTSAFYFYALLYRNPRYEAAFQTNPSNPIKVLLSNPQKFDSGLANLSFTNNRMSVDFGFPVKDIEESRHNATIIKEFVNYIDKTFHFVLVVEMFDESLILLRRMFNWTTKDILYHKSNSRHKHRNWAPAFMARDTTGPERSLHKKWAPLDYALYNHFFDKMREKIRIQPLDFQQELVSFQDIRNKVTRFCGKIKDSNSTGRSIGIESRPWDPGFCVTYKDCQRLSMNEMDITHASRMWQTRKLETARRRSKKSVST